MVKNIINIIFNDSYFIYLLLISLINRILSDDCIIESFPELKYPKSETLLNGYILMVTTTGIYSFNPLYITKFEYSYNFTEQQILSEDEIFNAQISQFSNVDEGKDYVLCYVKNFIYVLTNKGKFLFYENLDISNKNLTYIDLIAYEYQYPFYSFFLIYIFHKDQKYYSFINNYRLTIKNEEEHEIILFKSNSFDPKNYTTTDTYQTELFFGGLSCEIMITQESPENKLVCFIAIRKNNCEFLVMALEINPDSFSLMNLGETSGNMIVSLYSSLGEDKSKAFVCYMYEGGQAFCLYYNLNDKKFGENMLFNETCSPKIYSVNLYYFPQPKEFIFSCYDYSHFMTMKRLNNDFNIIPPNLTYADKKHFNCYDFFSYSIFYLVNINQYMTISHCKCNEVFMIRLFLISKDCDEFNKTQLYIIKDNALGTSNFKELNESEYLKTNDILKNTDNYEYSKSEKIHDKTIIPYLTDLAHTESNNIIYSTNKDRQIESDINTQNTELLKRNNYTDSQIEVEKSNFYNSEITEEISSYSTNLIKNVPTTDFKSEIINQESSILNNEMTDSKEVQLSYSNKEITEKISELNSEITGKISDFNSQISDIEKSSKAIVELIITNSENIENSVIDSNSNSNNIEKSTEVIIGITSYLSELENDISEKQETYVSQYQEFIISPDKCLCGENLSYLMLKNNKCIDYCFIDQLLDKTCQIDCVSKNNYNSIIKNIENIIHKDNFTNFKEIVINGNNVICDIITSQMEHKYKNISYIDFGECETKLKQKYKIDYLLIIKFDAKLNENSPINVQYKVYDPKTKIELDLSICSDDKITIDIPMQLVGNSLYLYQNLTSLGYDILNINDPFYNDICTTFSSEDNTDIILSDRRRAYYNENIILCDNGCEYISYESEYNLLRCKCFVKNSFDDEIKIINFQKENLSYFFNIKTYANFDIIKCYSLLFSKEGLTNNYGAYILHVIIFFYVIVMIIFYFNYKKNIIYLTAKAYPKYKYKQSSSSSPPKQYNSQTTINKIKIKEKLFLTPKRKIKQSQKKNLEINESKISNKIDYSTNKMMSQLICKKSKFNNLNNTIEIYKKNKTITYKLSDEEINSLEYNDAILIDKRTFCQYYFSLLLRKHIILFTFFSKNDYNLIHIKINIFFLSFSLFFALNVLFFTDKTMHKIYESKGIYYLIIQLPKIIYSSLITSVFNLIIRKFALSDKNIIDLKNIGRRKMKNEKLFKVILCLKIKFNIFFVIGFIFLCFCWYYISVFCSVYINTQIILLKDTFLSFGFSLLYPFILNLIPGLFRIPSLKYNNSPFLYNISKIISQI